MKNPTSTLRRISVDDDDTSEYKKNPQAPREEPGMFADVPPTKVALDQITEQNVDRNWWRAFAFVLGILLIATIFTIKALFPLKGVKVYRMEVDSVGNYKVTNMTATEYSPSENEVRARIKEMVERMFTLDAQFTKRNISKAESLMSGQARKQFEEFLFKEQPFARLVKSPALFREVKVHAVTKIEEKALHVDFTTIEREGTGEPKPVRKAMTLRYEVKAPETDDEVLGDNPSGIFVINFAIADRLN